MILRTSGSLFSQLVTKSAYVHFSNYVMFAILENKLSSLTFNN